MRIAITGGIADGKTTVCSMIAELGCKVVSADNIVSELYADPVLVDRVRSELGERFVSDGEIDRDALRRDLTDDNLRPKLNAIFHPRVIGEIVRRTEGDTVAFAEVPLLIETATQGLFDEVWVVTAGTEEQRRRLINRLGNPAEADALLGTQLPTAAKIPFADRVIRTNEAVETVRLEIAVLVKDVTERASRT